MPYWPPDTPPEPPPQMPAAGSGPAPVPYAGPGFALAPGVLAPVPDVPAGATPGGEVMGGVTGANFVTESPLGAPNVNPYEAGAVSPIYVGGDNDPGGRDDVAGAVAAAVANAEARFTEHLSDLSGQGSVIGDLMTLPPSPVDPAAGPEPAGAFYDPPRDYGG